MWTASYHTWAENRLTGPEYPPVHPTPSPRPAPCFWLRGDFEQACSLEQGGDILEKNTTGYVTGSKARGTAKLMKEGDEL